MGGEWGLFLVVEGGGESLSCGLKGVFGGRVMRMGKVGFVEG